MMSIVQKEKPHCLWVAIDHDDVFIRLTGRATFAISPSLKQLGSTLINRPCGRFVLDMAECECIDSTFIGVLAGFSMRLKKTTGSSIIIVNLPPDIHETICILGLNQIASCFPTGMCPQDIQDRLQRLNNVNCIEMKPADKNTTKKTMTEAHMNLVQINSKNLPRFKDVLTFLREDLKNEDNRS